MALLAAYEVRAIAIDSNHRYVEAELVSGFEDTVDRLEKIRHT